MCHGFEMKKAILLLLLLSDQAMALNTITLFAFKSSVGIDWSSPKALAASVVKNEAMRYLNGNERLLGHVAVKLNCGANEILTAMTSREGETKRTVLKEHSGLGVLFHIFPGLLENEDKLVPEISKKRKNGFVHSVTYIIDESACELMLEHYENFIAQGGSHNYGFPLDTLAGEGGGCSAYGVSFLQKAKLNIADHLKAWAGSVWVPNEFIGPYNKEKYTSSNQNVHPNLEGGDDVKLVPMLLKPKKTFWAPPHSAGARYLEFFDPDMMFQWIESTAKNWNRNSPYQYRKFGKSYDIVFDQRPSNN